MMGCPGKRGIVANPADWANLIVRANFPANPQKMAPSCVSEVPILVAQRRLDHDRRLGEQSQPPPWGGDNDSIGYGGS
jgi:hypothetical protein